MNQKNYDLSKFIKKWYCILCVSFVLTLLIFTFCSTSFMQETEFKLLDHRFRFDPTPAKADTNIVLVAIDDYSLDFFSENGISWPWPRNFYGFAVDYFTSSGAKSVIFDMQFYEKDIDREETYAWETDAAFAETTNSNGNVFLGTQLLIDSTYVNSLISNSALDLINEYPFSYNYKGIRAPIDTLLSSVKALGVINVVPDNDGVIRRIPLLFKLGNSILPQMSLQVVKNENPQDLNVLKNELKIDDKKIPFDKNGNYLINWYGNTKEKQPFKTYPFRAVIVSASAVINGEKPFISPDSFKGKHVIIGATAAGLMDLKTNPYSKIMPGIEIWATTLSNFLNEDYINKVPVWIDLMITFLLIYFVLFFTIHLSATKANILSFLLLAITVVFNFLLWKYFRILLNFVMPAVGFIISYLLVNIVSYLLEGKSRRQIRKMFSRYINEEVIQQLEKDPEQVRMGGEEITATVLYTDIYNFTTISETKTPTELVTDLNSYFEILVNLVFKYSGLLDKYTGDGIMAIFGAPLTRSDHASLACHAAFAHKIYRETLSKKEHLSAVEKFHMKTRIGINSGKLIAGNIGSDKRMDYTAIGDTVNLAARLEGVNKIYETNIIISEFTYEMVKDEFLCRELDSLRVKGKNDATRIYEIIEEYSGSDKIEKPDWIKKYEEALRIYRDGNFRNAGKIFAEISNSSIKDSASKIMFDRCRYLKKSPPKKWDGILTLDVK